MENVDNTHKTILNTNNFLYIIIIVIILLLFIFRVRNPSSEIFNVLCTPPTPNNGNKTNGHHTPRRSSQHNDSFTRLFGTPEKKKITPRRGSLTKQGTLE